jgi:hypothetical protein
MHFKTLLVSALLPALAFGGACGDWLERGAGNFEIFAEDMNAKVPFFLSLYPLPLAASLFCAFVLMSC